MRVTTGTMRHYELLLVKSQARLPPTLLSDSGQSPPSLVHVPALQGPFEQALLQPPQFLLSMAVFTHWPAQSVVAPVHTKPQAPALQLGTAFSGAAQATPHAPQCATLVSRSTHSLAHGVPLEQLRVHFPFAHTWPAAQPLPQTPQFWKLELVSTQTPLQAT